MVEYLKNGPFSVQMGGDQKYRDNFDAIDWGKKPSVTVRAEASPVLEDRVVVENYAEGDCAPTAAMIAAVEPTEVRKIEFTEEHEKAFDEYLSSINRGYDVVPLKEIEGSIQHDVREFHRVMGQPIAPFPCVPSDERVRHRLRLIHEEYTELLTACGILQPYVKGGGVYNDILRAINNDPLDVDLVEVADALADIAYVVEGANLEFGIDSEAVLSEVQRSNLAKLGSDGKPVVDATGKVRKPDGWTPPNIAKVLGLV